MNTKPKDTTPIKIIIADDHPLCLQGLSKMIGKFPEFKIIGEARDGSELVRLARELKPDIIITDIRMPVMDGIQATRQLSSESCQSRIIALSMMDQSSQISDMIAAGARGYLLKNASAQEIIASIKSVHHGEMYYCKDTTEQLTKLIATKQHGVQKKNTALEFSDREVSIIKLICEGFSHKEIAHKLHLSTRTIEWHKNQLMEKLDAKNSAGIVVYAVKNKICT
jgi:two-component system response regulator NreC